MRSRSPRHAWHGGTGGRPASIHRHYHRGRTYRGPAQDDPRSAVAPRWDCCAVYFTCRCIDRRPPSVGALPGDGCATGQPHLPSHNGTRLAEERSPFRATKASAPGVAVRGQDQRAAGGRGSGLAQPRDLRSGARAGRARHSERLLCGRVLVQVLLCLFNQVYRATVRLVCTFSECEHPPVEDDDPHQVPVSVIFD